MEKRYDPVINDRLTVFAKKSEWLLMRTYLCNLSNSGFRTASYVLAEHVLTTLENDAFWQCFATIAQPDTKVYLKTFLKAAVLNYKRGALSFNSHVFLGFARTCLQTEATIDRQKTLQLLLPELCTYEEVELLLSAFCGDNCNVKLRHLTSCAESKPCYYALFRLMKQMDMSHDRIAECLKVVARRATPMAFNFTSIMKLYFDVEDLRGDFSLQMRAYEVSRIENSYTNFVDVITCM